MFNRHVCATKMMAGSRRVTFIYTNSYDATADVVVSRLGAENVFRFNLDLWRDYSIRIGPRDFALEDPSGRVLRPEDIAKAYWRKPRTEAELFPDRACGDEQSYMEAEVCCAMLELISFLWADGKLVLVEPNSYLRVGKLAQMRLAADLFQVPPWKFVCGGAQSADRSAGPVVKSLTSNSVCGQSVLFTSRVDEAELDPKAPWLIQEYVAAASDVTVVYVRGDLYAFALPRASFLEQTVDWREVPDAGASGWSPHVLPARVQSAIRTYMQRLALDFGRIDLLRRGEDEYVFLEVNANGEWAWLDADGRHGLMDRMLEELSPATAVHPIGVPDRRLILAASRNAA